MPINAILFDLDGTLLDTLDDLADAANRVLAAAGLPTHERSAYRRFVGDGSRMLMTRTLPHEHRTPERIEELLTRFKEAYGRHWKTATRPYPGINDLLREFGLQPGPRIGELLEAVREAQVSGEVGTREQALVLVRSCLAARQQIPLE